MSSHAAAAAASDDEGDCDATLEQRSKVSRREHQSASATAVAPSPADQAAVDQLVAVIRTCDFSGLEPSSPESVRIFIARRLLPKLQDNATIRVNNPYSGQQLSKSDTLFPTAIEDACESATGFEGPAFVATPKPETLDAIIECTARYLVTSPFRVCVSTEALTIFTVAEKAAACESVLPACAQSAGGCLIASTRDRLQTMRERDVKVAHRPWVLPASADDGAADSVLGPRAFAERVGVVVGPSGVGKTRFMLTAKPEGTTQMLTFYMTAYQIEQQMTQLAETPTHGESSGTTLSADLLPHLKQAGFKSAPGSTVAFKAFIGRLEGMLAGPLQGAGSDSETDVPKRARNVGVLAAIAALVHDAVSALEQDSKLAGSRWTGLDAGSNVRVRLAIDEAGLHEGVTRAVIATGSAIRAIVRAACKITDAAVPVDVLVGGTGSGAPERAHGSEHHRAKYHVLDVHACFSEMFSDAFALPTPVRKLLENRENPATSQSILAVLSGMVSNARLGALLHLGLAKVESWGRRLTHLEFPATALAGAIPESVDALESHVRGVALDAMQCFCRLNGLADLSLPGLQQALADAMSIDINGFDGIGDLRTDAEKKNCTLTLRERLVTRYGVLHDRARLMQRSAVPPHQRVICDDHGISCDQDTVLCVPNDCRGRYVMQPAARELFMTECVRPLPRVRGGDDPEGLERLLWQWGAALQLCVFEGSSLRELLGHVCRGREPLDVTPSHLIPVPGRDKMFTRRALASGPSGNEPGGTVSSRGELSKMHRTPQPPPPDPFSSAARGTVPSLARLSGMHLVKAQVEFPAKMDCFSMLDACTPSAMSVMNVPKASAADAAVYSLLSNARESVAFQAKLFLKTSVSQSGKAGLDEEFAKLPRATKATRVFFVVGPSSRVNSNALSLPTPTPATDVRHVLVHVETDENGVVPSARKESFRNVFGSVDEELWRFSPLFPMAVGRVTTWGPLANYR